MKLELKQVDFDHGSYFAKQPGQYVLTENIVFEPNASLDCYPTKEQRTAYRPFLLGFFAAFIVASDDVELDGNGYGFDMSLKFSLQQRWYTHVCIGPSPFRFGTGPGTFILEKDYFALRNIRIHNVKFGLSSHHGILGNDAKQVLIEKNSFTNFEVAAIALNGASSEYTVRDVDIGPSLQKVPLASAYSAARLVRQFVQEIIDRDDTLTFKGMNGVAILQRLQKKMDQTLQQVIAHGATQDPLFDNAGGQLNEGTQYAIVVHGVPGPAIKGQYKGSPQTKNVTLERIKIQNLKTNAKHILGLSVPGNVNSLPAYPHSYQTDCQGGQIQIKTISDSNGAYTGTVLSDAQLFVAKHGQNDLELGKNCITMHTVNWAEGKDINPLLHGAAYQAGADFMGHVSKPMYALRLEGIDNLTLSDIEIESIENQGQYPSTDLVLTGCPYKPHPDATLAGLHSSDVVAFGLSSCTNVQFTGNIKVNQLRSWYGNAKISEINFSNSIKHMENVQSSNIESMYYNTNTSSGQK